MISYEEVRLQLTMKVLEKHIWRTFAGTRRKGSRIVFQIPFFGSDNERDIEISSPPFSLVAIRYSEISEEVYDYIFSKGKVEIPMTELLEYKKLLDM